MDIYRTSPRYSGSTARPIVYRGSTRRSAIFGIFVSGSFARREHDEFARQHRRIDVLPPGFEAVDASKDVG